MTPESCVFGHLAEKVNCGGSDGRGNGKKHMRPHLAQAAACAAHGVRSLPGKSGAQEPGNAGPSGSTLGQLLCMDKAGAG